MLQLIDVKKTYITKAGNTTALNGINITFPDKGMVFITGKSGCGKTTLLNVIGGLDSIDEGEIIIDGKKFSEFSSADYDSYRNTFVGFVFQEYNLLTEYTVEKNIDIAEELQGRKASKEELEEMLKVVDIGGYSQRKPTQMSGGQKQRVAIARALIKNPKIIMADEPTGALDSASGVQVMELLKKLSKEKLVIVVSHELDFAEKYADRIIRIIDGKIVEDITLNEVEVKGNIFESETEMIVKAGSQLNQKETQHLVSAIKENKKINIIEKISIKQKSKTGKVEVNAHEEPKEFIKSKMKFKSVAELGLKSLFVKPIRLIFTILLSVIAFAVFGVFDSVASYNDTRALTNLLRSSSYSAVSVYSTYSDKNYTDAKFKMTEEYINSLSNSTGYAFRGVYDIEDLDNDFYDAEDGRGNFNREWTIKEVSTSQSDNPVGKDYWIKKVNGLIEFNIDEIGVDGSFLVDGFRYKVKEGTYPKRPNATVTLQEVGISYYMAESIMFWLKRKGANEFGGKTISENYGVEEIVGAELSFSSCSQRFIISAIIDCGEISSKYNSLQTIKGNVDYALAQDFLTYMHSSGHLLLFAPQGYVNFHRQQVNRVTSYVANYSNTEYFGTVDNKRTMVSKQFYNLDEFNGTNTIMFNDLENVEKEQGVKPQLAKNEVILSAYSLKLLFAKELEQAKNSDLANDIRELINQITDLNKPLESKRWATKQLLEKAEIVREANPTFFGDEYQKTIKVETWKEGEKTQQETKQFIVKGIYFGVNIDKSESIASQNYSALLLSDEGFNELGINKQNQGIYSRAIAPLRSNYFGASTLGNMMAQNQGIKLNWYQNAILSTLAENTEFIAQFSRLFLYVALVVVVFSVFMLFNYILTSIISKRQSIGVLRGLGASGKNIFHMFLIESLIISIINGILACIVSYIASSIVNNYILTIMNLGVRFVLFGFRQIIIIMVASLTTGFLSSLLPIIKISKEKPVELIRKE